MLGQWNCLKHGHHSLCSKMAPTGCIALWALTAYREGNRINMERSFLLRKVERGRKSKWYHTWCFACVIAETLPLAPHVFWLAWITALFPPLVAVFLCIFSSFINKINKIMLTRHIEQGSKVDFSMKVSFIDKPSLQWQGSEIVDSAHVLQLCGINRSSWFICYWANGKCNGTLGGASH